MHMGIIKYSHKNKIYVYIYRHTMNISVIGSVDNGKTSLIARILLNSSAIKHNELNKNINTHKNWLAHLIDSDEAEKERGMTLNSSIERFNLSGRPFNIINNPGHRSLLNQVIQNSCQADIALLVLSAKKNEIDNSIKQSYDHALISRVFGINHMIIAMNKCEFLNDDNKYEDIKAKVKKAYKNIKFNTIHMVPTSAKLNINIQNNDSVNCNQSLFDILKNINVFRRESRTIKPINNEINCKLFFHTVNHLITSGFHCLLHSYNKIFNIEILKINNKSSDFIDCKLKIKTCEMIDYAILLKINDDILAYGIIY